MKVVDKGRISGELVLPQAIRIQGLSARSPPARPTSLFGWLSDYRAEGCGFEPWPDQHSRS